MIRRVQSTAAIALAAGPQCARDVETQTLLGLNNADLVIDGVPFFGVSLVVELAVG